MSYRRELEKYRDLDEDEILEALTEEELRTLENELDELDPDVSIRKAEHWPGVGVGSVPTLGGGATWPPYRRRSRWALPKATNVFLLI